MSMALQSLKDAVERVRKETGEEYIYAHFEYGGYHGSQSFYCKVYAHGPLFHRNAK